MTTNKTAEAAKGDAQEQVDEEQKKGYRGDKVDPTPNEHYTVPGVLAGLPTPETDPEHAHKVRSELQEKAHGR